MKIDTSFGGYVSVTGFGQDDVLQFNAGSQYLLAVSSSSGNAVLVANDNGIVTHVELRGVAGNALVYDTASFNALPVGDVVFTGGQYPNIAITHLDLLGGSLTAPAQLDAGARALRLTDAAGSASVTQVLNFGADDSIRFTGITGAQDIAVSSQGGDVYMTVNQQGVVSTITLMGVVDSSQIIHDVASFNALPVGNILF